MSRWTACCDSVGSVVVLSQGRRCVAFDAAGMRELCRFDVERSGLGAIGYGAAVSSRGGRWFGAVLGAEEVVCVDFGTGREVWSRSLRAVVNSIALNHVSGVLWAAVETGELISLRMSDGGEVERRSGAGYWALDGGRVECVLGDRGSLTVERAGRVVRVELTPEETARIIGITAHEGLLAVSGARGGLAVFSVQDGSMLWGLPAKGLWLSDIVWSAAGDRILGFGSEEGRGMEKLLVVDVGRRSVGVIPVQTPDQREFVDGCLGDRGRYAVLFNGYLHDTRRGTVVRLPWVTEGGELG